MRAHRFLLPALLVLSVLVLILKFSPAEGTGIYTPTGYINEVNRLIGEGKLEYDCRRDRISKRGLTDAEEYFYRNSYLRKDVAAWNDQGDRRPFIVEREDLGGGRCDGRVVAANESHHKQRLPTYVADTWRGSLYLRQSRATTTLTSVERTIEVVPPLWDLLPLPARAFEDVWFGRDTPGSRSQQLALKMLEQGRAFATLKTIGDAAAVEVVHDRPSLTLNGCPLPLGWRVRLDDGDLVRVQLPGRLDERYSVESGARAGLLSFVRTVNEEPRRKTYADRLPMARDIAWAIDAAVIAGRSRRTEPTEDAEPQGGRDDFDVYLTLDPYLGHTVERQVSAFCRDRYGKRPLRAAVTVLEASSGRLLALASYPSPNDLDDLVPGASGETTTRRQLLRRNHNFLQHPVGSAAKPFLAAAALAGHPSLGTLRIPCFPGGEPPRELLGYDLGAYHLPSDCSGAPDGRRVDFDGFLRVSSNRYMLYLGLLAMADWKGGPGPAAARPERPLSDLDRYELGGRSFTSRPLLGIFKDDSGAGLTELKEVGEQDFVRRFRDLFEVGVHYQRGSTVDDLDLSYWQPVIEATLGNAARTEAISFSEVAPERVNLRTNLIQQLRQDLYTLLLGTGNNRWSNVQLAQAMARVTTGRPVRARLLERVVVADRAGEDAAAAPPQDEVLWDLEEVLAREEQEGWAPFDDEWQRRGKDALERVRDALRGVVSSPGGTAHDLNAVLKTINDAAPPGVRYSALGKTGTPTSALAAVERSPTQHAPEALERYSGNAQVKSGALVLALRREKDGEASELVLTFYVEAQGGSEQAVDLAAGVLRPLVESYWPEDWLDGR